MPTFPVRDGLIQANDKGPDSIRDCCHNFPPLSGVGVFTGAVLRAAAIAARLFAATGERSGNSAKGDDPPGAVECGRER